jgi:hypothetical protein
VPPASCLYVETASVPFLEDTMTERQTPYAEEISDAADARTERIIRETAAHFGTMAPAIIAVSRHVILNVDGVAEGLDVCECLTMSAGD